MGLNCVCLTDADVVTLSDAQLSAARRIAENNLVPNNFNSGDIREAIVAVLTDGRLVKDAKGNDDIIGPYFIDGAQKRTGLDVIDSNNNLINVGGPGKFRSDRYGGFKNSVDVYIEEAKRRGVGTEVYLARGERDDFFELVNRFQQDYPDIKITIFDDSHTKPMFEQIKNDKLP